MGMQPRLYCSLVCFSHVNGLHHFAGFADIMGRNYGIEKLPYNHSKSYIGSLAFFAAASLASMG
jgi:dolichol kinase